MTGKDLVQYSPQTEGSTLASLDRYLEYYELKEHTS